MKFNAEIEGLDSWNSWASSITTSLGTEVTKAVDNSGSNIQRAARFNVPVDTGDLRKSILKSMEHGSTPTTEVSTNLHYSEDVELGTSKQRAQPYLFPALNQEVPKLENKIKQIVRSRLN